jgi:hypothetical protein
MYIQYIQGLYQPRLSAANHALLLIAPATTAGYSLERVVCLTAAKFKPLTFPLACEVTSLISILRRHRRKHSLYCW